MSKKSEISYKQEIIRKAIHMNSLSIPIVYSFISQETALTILIPLAIIAISLDFLSKINQSIQKVFYTIFGKIMRPYEVNKKFVLNGASWVLISAILCIWVFPKPFAITGFAILIISDVSAALIGRRYGKHKLFNKSWEGTSAFIISAFLVILFIGIVSSAPYTYFVFGFASAIISGFVEAASGVMKIDDNISIPVSVGIVLWAGSLYADSINASYIFLLN